MGSADTIIAELSPPIVNEAGLEQYYKKSLQNVLPLINMKSAEIIYSAKDIPFFHTLKDSYLTRYKIYVWLKDVNIEMSKNKITFDEWIKTIPESLLQSAYDLSEVYNYINISELWNDSTVTGTLQQVLYYFEAGMVSKEMALNVLEDVEEVISHTEKQTIMQSLTGAKTDKTYHLYKCDLHMLSNTIMVKTSFQKVFFQPFTILSYMKIEHSQTCELMYEFFQKQMAISKLLATAGERDRTLFFNRIHQKIKIARDRIKMDETMSFL